MILLELKKIDLQLIQLEPKFEWKYLCVWMHIN